MKPDKFDIKIQEAAAQNEAAYDEQAWSAMEKLLDEKMPQKKKRKKRFLWLFLFIFIATGGALLLMWSSKNTMDTTASATTITAETSTRSKDDHVLMNQKNKTTENISSDPAARMHEPAHKKSRLPETIMNTGVQRVAGKKTKDNNDAIFSRREKETENGNNPAQQKAGLPVNKESPENNNEQINAQPSGKDVVKEDKIVSDIKDSSVTISNDHDSTLKKVSAANQGKKFANSFSLHFSLGADVSAVSLKNIGKVQPIYGAGISYMINKKFTVRTGFYIARKVYDAKKSEYDPPARFWNYYPDLKSIEADCMIYEVPLLVNYNFKQSQNHQWFISAGLSSYFMKKEDYDYFSKTPSGLSRYDSYQIRNKNQHYFSSLRLAAGYEKRLGKNISLMAEPYVSLPLTGVGYGKVKLYSAGVLFSVGIKPFAKK
jgi:hypothetical protein